MQQTIQQLEQQNNSQRTVLEQLLANRDLNLAGIPEDERDICIWCYQKYHKRESGNNESQVCHSCSLKGADLSRFLEQKKQTKEELELLKTALKK